MLFFFFCRFMQSLLCVFHMNHLHEQISSRYSNVGAELVRVDYGEDFTTYEIFESRETLIKWAREVAMAQGFFLVVKRSNVSGMRKKMKGYS